ncbi:ABC transporter permease [[Mannheimia] succiniciproducens]|uniref:ABC transmembrane type-2 domain-containing protein n=1 Tax=Mannheimia succiniciproducens (strain KCTC 0769BP / MBEL55E) TaxID=221988 RepID=Q65T00_MANSM|nr:ABC transporter permease [[Mannheimia] succiniciproducens]AAU37910.1 unknown [[Mannheimia] succiniciproducens MBEL55E]
MRRWLKNVFFLSGKEFRSLFSDPILVILIIYMFTAALYTVATTISTEVKNGSVAVINNDHSTLSYRLQSSLIPPYFRKVHEITANQADRLMDMGEYTFVIDIPPNYEVDILAGRNPQIHLSIDATAMTQAAIGSNYISQIFSREINDFLRLKNNKTFTPIKTAVNVLYNPNYTSKWFMGAMQIVGNLNLLTMLLVGAAIIRERERGTIEHLLVMPVTSSEIAIAKIIANGSVLLVVVGLSLRFVTGGLLGVPLPAQAIPLFILGSLIFIFAIASLGIMLAIFAPTMPQFGLLCIPVYVVMYLLSGTTSPIENMPELAQWITQLSPTTIFGSYAQDVIFRGASLDLVWDKLVKMAAIGFVFLAVALGQFKTMLSRQG